MVIILTMERGSVTRSSFASKDAFESVGSIQRIAHAAGRRPALRDKCAKTPVMDAQSNALRSDMSAYCIGPPVAASISFIIWAGVMSSQPWPLPGP